MRHVVVQVYVPRTVGTNQRPLRRTLLEDLKCSCGNEKIIIQAIVDDKNILPSDQRSLPQSTHTKELFTHLPLVASRLRCVGIYSIVLCACMYIQTIPCRRRFFNMRPSMVWQQLPAAVRCRFLRMQALTHQGPHLQPANDISVGIQKIQGRLMFVTCSLSMIEMSLRGREPIGDFWNTTESEPLSQAVKSSAR